MKRHRHACVAIALCALASLLPLTGCNRNGSQELDPFKQKLIGKWDSPTPTTSAALNLNDDGTFRYQFSSGSGDPFIVTGDWTVEEKTIIGLVKTIENGNYYKIGDTYPIGEVVKVDENSLKLQKKNGVELYHRLGSK